MSENIVDHRHKDVIKKCRLKWIGLKANLMPQYQAIRALLCIY